MTEFELQVAAAPDPESEARKEPRVAYRGPDWDCTVAGLLPGRAYLYSVRAFNSAGVSHSGRGGRPTRQEWLVQRRRRGYSALGLLCRPPEDKGGAQVGDEHCTSVRRGVAFSQ